MSAPGLTLSNCRRVMQVTSAKGDIPEDHKYFKGKLDSTNSLFIVYGTPDFGKAEKGSKPGVVIDTTDMKPLGFNARSVNAFDKNGIVLFEYPNFAGEGTNFIESVTRVGYGSSFIVSAGMWELLLSSGEKLTVDGKTLFGPETKVTSISEEIVSAKRVE